MSLAGTYTPSASIEDCRNRCIAYPHGELRSSLPALNVFASSASAMAQASVTFDSTWSCIAVQQLWLKEEGYHRLQRPRLHNDEHGNISLIRSDSVVHHRGDNCLPSTGLS